MGVIITKEKPRLCYRCRKEPIAKGRQLYCGSYKRKEGCSYIVHIQRQKDAWRNWEKKYPEKVLVHRARIEKLRKESGYYQSEKKKQYDRAKYQRNKLKTLTKQY